MTVYVAEVTAYDPDLGEEVVLLFSTDVGFATAPTDTPANTEVLPVIIQPAMVKRDAHATGKIGGASTVGVGELVLNNSAGALDAFGRYAVDGRAIKIRYAASRHVPYPAGYTSLFSGTMEQAETHLNRIIVRLRDRQVFTVKPLNTNKYLGTNVLPNGLEGIETDLKGKPKPRVFGWVSNIEPVLVNTSRLIYQVNDGPIRDVVALYDSGSTFVHGPDYADLDALQNEEPEPRTYRVYKAGGYFRMGSAASGHVTCDVVEGLTPADRTVAQIFKRVYTGPAGQSLFTLSSAHITALDAQNRASVGHYWREEIEIQQALDEICASAGARWGDDADGIMEIERLEAPAGEPVLTITGAIISDNSFRVVPMDERNGGLPDYRVTVRGCRNYTVQTTGLAGNVSAARRARLAQPFQDSDATDLTILDAYKLAGQRIVETHFVCHARLGVEAARLLAMLKVRRKRVELTIKVDLDTMALIRMYAVVRLTYPRYEFGDGKLMRILGYQLDPRGQRVHLTLWG